MLFLREIFGHKPIVKTLINAVTNDRVAHAYLFTGPEGVGKATSALAFTRALLCSSSSGGDACGSCQGCRQLIHSNHPDFYRLGPVGLSIKIEQIRELQRKIKFRSYKGGRQVFLIEQAETMTAEAANCLLKTLEEPPIGTVLILLSARPQALLPTIISRCQQLYFKHIPSRELSSYLSKLYNLHQEEARLLAVLSGGSMGKALACATGAFQEERAEAIRLAAGLREAGITETMELAGEIARSKKNILNLIELLACWYRDILVWKETGEVDLLYNPDLVNEVKLEAEVFEIARLVEILGDIEKLKSRIRFNTNMRLALESIFLRLSCRRRCTRKDWGD
ncbi:MAG: DNA polymerase III subunit delta' [Desulfotomaculaceae bacterium]|nr:DNA polymerase III subunit delta' [Desulfotomaculaceae bacterium]